MSATALPGGIMGKLLRVDLSSGRTWAEPVTPELAHTWIGGTGLGARIMYDEVPPGVEWDDPANRVVIAAGPLGGTAVHGSGTYSAATKGPMTNLIGTTQANGYLGAYLKQCGYDAIVLQGRAPTWQYLWVADGQVELRDASHLLGLDTWETEERLLAELGYKERTLSVHGVGPAGEHLVRFAALAGDKGHVAAHNGVGAVVGAKRLKCIAVARGKQKVPVARPEALAELNEQLFQASAAFRDGSLNRGGTALNLPNLVVVGQLPVKNYQTNVYEAANQMDGAYFRSHFQGRLYPCWACRMKHLHLGCMTVGKDAGYVGEEAEYEGFAAMGPQIANTDQSAAFKLCNIADRIGVDLNETGWLVGWVMECYDKGALTRDDLDGLDLTWGNTEAVERLLYKIARREGCGAWLAEGVMRASQRLGGEAARWAVYAQKGASPRGHDHRGRPTEMLDTCVSNTSTIEATAGADPTDYLDVEPVKNRFDPIDVSTFAARINGRRQFDDCLGVCNFDLRELRLEVQVFNAVTGLDYTVADAVRKGRQIVHLLRAFNFRHGLTTEVEAPSERYGSPQVDGAAAGSHAGAHFGEMKRNYYRLMGWDEETGKPLPQTLRSLDLEWLIPAFA
ncbi:MAG: hypothetical protein HY690_19675 [Chloroflexi bacterium]|nr:hypothetical protein [Chloroflexota bacterium]